jgi:hypothetical protein
VTSDSIEVRKGQYSATQLLTYLRALESIRSDPDVWAIEQDTELNRIWLGLQTPLAKVRIQAAIAQLHVPADAVSIEDAPDANGGEAFEVLEGTVHTYASSSAPAGLFNLDMHVRFTNRYQEMRYPYPCELPLSAYLFFEFRLSRWNGSDWVHVFTPVCDLNQHDPQPVASAAEQTDSIPVAASRRLNTIPVWLTTRVTGTYRFEGVVFLSTIPSPPFVANLAPLDQRVSAPFRILSSARVP